MKTAVAVAGAGEPGVACGHCGSATTHYRLPNHLTGEPEDLFECEHCRRRLVNTSRGLLWMPLGGYCPNCKGETWVHVEHPRHGIKVPLWPKPTSVTPLHWTPDGHAIHGSFCGDCCPDVGAPACQHVTGAHPEAGGVIGHEHPRDRYAFRFTDGYGAWLRAWLTDELRLDDVERDRLLAQWEEDRGL